MKNVVLLNGSSSSGKSSLAGKLVEKCQSSNIAAVVVSGDDFLDMSRREIIHGENEFDIPDDMCKAVREALTFGKVVVIDYIITSERNYKRIMDSVGAAEILRVRVKCPVEELRRRERARGGRCIGLAEASLKYLYFPWNGYDMIVDTYKYKANQIAEKIYQRMLLSPEEEERRKAEMRQGGDPRDW